MGPQLGQLDNVVALMGTLSPDDLADLIGFTVSRPRHVNLRQAIVLPTRQA